MKRPLILISNDDGIQAPGILALVQAARLHGDVMVVAPDGPQSAMGHAISVSTPLRVTPGKLLDGSPGFACDGTPADCVKLATGVRAIMPIKPDLVISGINHGNNSSVSCIYSGTLSAAREGAIQGYPAIAFSLCNFANDADMGASREIAGRIIGEAIEKQLAPGQLLSVNIPNLPLEQIKGIKITRQAMGRWVEEFNERIDPHGRPYYWLTGRFQLLDEGEETDEHALADGYVSITPMMHDLTEHHRITEYKSWHWSL